MIFLLFCRTLRHGLPGLRRGHEDPAQRKVAADERAVPPRRISSHLAGHSRVATFGRAQQTQGPHKAASKMLFQVWEGLQAWVWHLRLTGSNHSSSRNSINSRTLVCGGKDKRHKVLWHQACSRCKCLSKEGLLAH